MSTGTLNWSNEIGTRNVYLENRKSIHEDGVISVFLEQSFGINFRFVPLKKGTLEHTLLLENERFPVVRLPQGLANKQLLLINS